jgi:cation transport protein ChaC
VWVFGYGSLMWWNEWESRFDCAERCIATVAGYRRVLNKASVANWGSASAPGPTLNLVSDGDASCTGMAFNIPPTKEAEALAYLHIREGRDFNFVSASARLADERVVVATVAIYAGGNLVSYANDDELVSKIVAARGTSGRAIDYVLNLVTQLGAMGVDDPELTRIAARLRATPSD